MSEAFEERELVHLAPNPLFRWLARGLAAIGVTAFVAGSWAHVPPAAVLGFYAIMGSLVATAVRRTRNPRPKRRDVRVSADAAGVRVDGELVPRSEIKEGFLLPRGAEQIVRLARRGFHAPLELAAPDEKTARELLRALDFDASQTVARFRTPSRALAHRGWLTASSLFFGVSMSFMSAVLRTWHLAPFVPLVMMSMMLVLVGFMLVPTRLEIGVDGILLTWLGRRRFLRFDEITGVLRYVERFGRSRTAGLNVTLASGEVVKIPVGSSRFDDERVAIVEERIREAMEIHRAGDGEADASVLRRGERDLRGWIDQLRRLGAGANADARTAPLDPERLLRIALDPKESATDRAAAAVALGAQGNDDVRARLRAAASATAAPKLRVALEAAGDAEKEAELEAALAELDEDDRAKTTSAR